MPLLLAQSANAYGRVGSSFPTHLGNLEATLLAGYRFYLRERIPDPVNVTRRSWKDKQMGFE